MYSMFFRVNKALLSLLLVVAIVFSAISFLTIDSYAYVTNAYTIGVENPEATNYFQLGQYRLNLYKNVKYEIEGSGNKRMDYGTLKSAAYRFYNYYNVASKWKVTIKSITFQNDQWPQNGGPKNQGWTNTSTALSGNFNKPSNWTRAQIISGGETYYNIGTRVSVKFYLTNDKTKKIYTKTFVNTCAMRAEYYL